MGARQIFVKNLCREHKVVKKIWIFTTVIIKSIVTHYVLAQHDMLGYISMIGNYFIDVYLKQIQYFIVFLSTMGTILKI